MALLPPAAPTPASKPKTEAKARYLKKKKDKLKKRKAAAVASAPKGAKAAAAAAPATDAGSDGESSEDEEEQEPQGLPVDAKSKKRKADDKDGKASPAAVEPDAAAAASTSAAAAAAATAPTTAEPVEETKEERKARKKEKKRRRIEQEKELERAQGEASAPAAAAPAEEQQLEADVPLASTSQHASGSSSGSRSPSPGPSRRSRSPTPDLDTLPLEPFPHQPPSVPWPTADLLHPLTVPHALAAADVISFSHTLPLPDKPGEGAVPLSARVLQRLKELQVSSLFAVQTAVIPFLLPPPAGEPAGASSVAGLYPLRRQRDVCVSAPTGSGKTLSYVVPIVEVLQKRVVTRLRALVILPTRDLVSQTRETFEAVAKGTGLRLATVTGSQSFATEQSYLVDPVTGHSLVDILVCTPGRLMDHLAGTANFSLRDLRFLVIDEADRLLNQSFNDWLQVVLARTREAAHEARATAAGGGEGQLMWEGRQADSSVNQCQKLLFSATLTRDPAKIAALSLVDPQYFIVQDDRDARDDSGKAAYVEEAFSVPATLKESFVVLPTSSKPLYLLSLLHSPPSSSAPPTADADATAVATAAAPTVAPPQITNALVFTKSVESASRLVKLLELFEAAHAAATGGRALVVRAYSSDLGGGGRGGERGRVLGAFAKGEIDILVCSDLIARGIDIPSVAHVISYDVPVDARKYVHRVGRTARAGRSGEAWSLVETQEARHFKELMRSFNHLSKLSKVVLDEKDLEKLRPAYEQALRALRDVYVRSGDA